MLWVYGHYKYFDSFSAGIDFRRQNLTSKVDPRAVSVNTQLSSTLLVQPTNCVSFYHFRQLQI